MKTTTRETPRNWAHKARFPNWCQWFAKCTNDAAGTVTHPILGEVPTCTRCARAHSLNLKKGETNAKA